MKNRNGLLFYLKKAAQGIIVSIVILVAVFAFSEDVIVGQLFLYETMPNYPLSGGGIKFSLKPSDLSPKKQNDYVTTFNINNGEEDSENIGIESYSQQLDNIRSYYSDEDKKDDSAEVYSNSEEPDTRQDVETYKEITIEDTITHSNSDDGIIGINDVIYQPEADNTTGENQFHEQLLTMESLTGLKDIKALKANLYTVDKRTDITEADFNIDTFAAADLRINNADGGPKVLVFNTHSNEMFSDSLDKSEGVVGLSKRLCELLNKRYNIKAVYTVGNFDVVDGKSQVLGAYERMEPKIKRLLAENPSIEVVIDLHRDGVAEDRRLVTEVNGKPTAQIMFFNGLSKVYEKGVLTPISSLPNPNLETNLAFSFQMQMAANNTYPGIARKIYLNAYRYSLHLMPKSLLVEVGAQTNTKAEAFNAIEPLAEMLASVLLGNERQLK